MQQETLQTLVGNTDIYLIDQILKGRYKSGDLILDAGCGEGRNLHWFIKNGCQVYGVDQNEIAIDYIKNANPEISKIRFSVSTVENLKFSDNFFDHIISSAVLHFAKDHLHFKRMFKEMLRVLKPGGTLFIRMTTTHGMEDIIENKSGVYALPDGTDRYLLTLKMLKELSEKWKFSLVEPFKTVLINKERSMCVLVLQKDTDIS